MQYVARFTFDPQYDIQRNWSAWMGYTWDTEKEALEERLFGGDWTEARDAYEAAIERGRIDEETSYIDWLRERADDEGVDVRFHEGAQQWMNVHHEGLSCFELDAETDADALIEAANSNFHWSGFGMATVGDVEYVGAVESIENLHVFKCERVTQEG